MRHERVKLRRYVAAAMARANFDFVLGAGWFGTVPRFHGLLVTAPTKEACRKDLRERLHDWILLNVRRRERLPIVGGFKLHVTINQPK